MKKFLTLSLLLIINISYVRSQDRVQEIMDGILMLGSTKVQIAKDLKAMGFTYKSNYKNITEYKKETLQGEFEFTVIYDKLTPNKISSVSWMEHKMVLGSISRELMELNFESMKGDYSTGIMGFKNTSRNLIVTLIIKDDSKAVFITIGAFNPKLPIKSQQVIAKNVANPKIYLPDARKMVKSKTRTHLTKYSKEQIINYYKAFGINQLIENIFYMPLIEGGDDSCICVTITKKGAYNLLEYSIECD